ncbi:LacI family DNA-binding transcriptional regulator [Desmospora profundinema]|uniref:LacI family transcriptional regulator n=1 Tax=Desmospora profundinema TaxID=1571184 RepID=A0ABU1IL52_9BACL|nr:LacI family DNA-binding transcriptional regulator [Desmospora profundinema]MDR6225426.1 LacI family transcriptional regulator [Desmospora profundinema]
MTTIRDVAKMAGVSVATVSRVINQINDVNKETENRVLRALRDLNYEPSTLSEGLGAEITATIAVILPDIVNPFFAELARAVEDTARAHRLTVIFCNSDDQGAKEKTYIEVLEMKTIDGILFASNILEGGAIDMMREKGIPFVLIDRAPKKGRCSVVRSKNAAGARMAVHHLIKGGCRKVAHIAGPQEFITARERQQGYLDVVGEADWFHPGLIVPGHFTIQGGKGAARALREHFPDVDGIFAGNDLMAVGALKALVRMGVNVPKEMALCGFDGVSVTEMTEPELTTIAQPIYEMGEAAVLELIKQMQGERGEDSVRELDVRLIERGSTRWRKE